MEFSTSTSTVSTRKYEDDTVDDFMRWVRQVPLESDALNNIPLVLASYEKRKTAWQVFKQLLKKL